MSTAPENEELHYCPVCLKGYKRREHLQRHRTTHNADRPYSCSTCSAAFKRTDILRRHMETCNTRRANQGVTICKRRACDRCVRQKKACNASSPCQNCEKRGASCQYSHVGPTVGPRTTTAFDAQDIMAVSIMPWAPDDTTDSASASSITMSGALGLDYTAGQPLGLQYGENWSALVHETVSDFNFLGAHVADMVDQEWPTSVPNAYGTAGAGPPVPSSETLSPDVAYQAYSFHFLADFTSRSGLVSSFDCGTLMQRREVASWFLQSTLDSASTTTPLAPLSGNDEIFTRLPGSDDDDHASRPLGLPALTPGWQSWLVNPVVIKLQQIVLRIKEVVVIKPRNSTITLSWSPALEARCLDFFSVLRFAKFLELYWSIWHPNVNFLHRPTFDPLDTPTPLLAAMAIIGMFCVIHI